MWPLDFSTNKGREAEPSTVVQKSPLKHSAFSLCYEIYQRCFHLFFKIEKVSDCVSSKLTHGNISNILGVSEPDLDIL